MKNQYLSLILLSFVPLTAMEQGALLVQKPVLKTAPSLKELTLKAYAKILRENTPEETISEKELVGWGEDMGLFLFYDKDLGDLLPRLKQILVEPTVIKTDLKCPDIFSPDGCSGFINDWENETQYIVHTDEQRSVDSITGTGVRFECDSDHYGRLPTFSPDARWMVGWENGKRASLIFIPCVLSSNNAMEKFSVPMANDRADYTFLDANTIILRTNKAIYASSIADFAAKGTRALKTVYYRSDMQEYPETLFYHTIHALSDSCIACVGPNEKSIEILKCDADGIFSLAKTVVIPNIFIGRLVVHNARGVAAMHVSPVNNTVHLCQLLGDDAGEKSTIDVESLENYLFSPDGNYLACGTNYIRQVIEIFDCKDLVSPQRIHVIQKVVDVGPVICMAWIERELVVRDGCGKKHVVTFNNRAALLVARYAACRNKQEKETHKNAS